MTRASLQITAKPRDRDTLGNNEGGSTANIVWWPDSIERRAAMASSGAGSRSRPPRQPGGKVIIWPRRFVPRRLADSDAAIQMTWKLYEAGVLSWDEAGQRETDLKAQRCAWWMWWGDQ
jgi:hypothetical protein